MGGPYHDARNAVGLDLERWLEEDLIDVLVGGFYMRLNPWKRLVDLGHAHDVAVYAGLSESRVQGDSSPFGRNSPESYRGRALREIGEPSGIEKLDRIYYATVRNRRPDAYLSGGGRFLNLPVVTPQNPLRVPVGRTQTIDLEVGEDLAASHEPLPEVKLYLQAVGASSLSASLNGRDLGKPQTDGLWTAFSVDPKSLAPGVNEVAVRAEPAATPRNAGDEWSVVYEGSAKPLEPWVGDRTSDDLLSVVEGGALHIADRGEDSGEYLYYAYPWNVDPSEETVVEARVQVVSGWSNIIVANGEAYERVALYPDRVAL